MQFSDRTIAGMVGKCLFAVAAVLLAGNAASQTYTLIELDGGDGDGSIAYRVNSSGQVIGYVLQSGPLAAFFWDETNGMQYLGTLPGGSEAIAYDMNETGQVVGYSGAPAHAFLWDATNGMQDLGTLPGGTNSMAVDINDLGQVVGYAYVGGLAHAFLWDATNGMQDLGVLAGYNTSSAFCMNEMGQVAGSLEDYLAGPRHAFLWDATNGMQDLGALPGLPWASPSSINNAGQIAGTAIDDEFVTSLSRAFVWDAANGMQDLGTLGGSDSQLGGLIAPNTALNEAGQAVGVSEMASFAYHAFVWDATNGMQDLGTLPGGMGSCAEAINGAGWIVGWGDKLIVKTAPSPPVTYCAILWKPASGNTYNMIDLSEHVELGPDWVRLQDPYDINEHGDIVGVGIKTPATKGVLTEERAFLLKRTRYTLTTSTAGLGAIVPAPGFHTYVEDTEVALSASPGPGWAFDHWEGDVTGSQAAATITMDADKTVTAAFVPLLPLESFVTLTISIEGSGATNPAEGVGLYPTGTDLEVQAFPAYGWQFSHWEGDASSQLNPLKISLYSDTNLKAVFLQPGLLPFECPGLTEGASHPALSADLTLLVMAAVLLAGLAVRQRRRQALTANDKS